MLLDNINTNTKSPPLLFLLSSPPLPSHTWRAYHVCFGLPRTIEEAHPKWPHWLVWYGLFRSFHQPLSHPTPSLPHPIAENRTALGFTLIDVRSEKLPSPK